MLNFPSDCCPSISLTRRKEKFPFPNLICDYFDCVTPRPARKTGTPFSRQILNPSSGRHRRLGSPFLLLISYEQKKNFVPPPPAHSRRGFLWRPFGLFFIRGQKVQKRWWVSGKSLRRDRDRGREKTNHEGTNGRRESHWSFYAASWLSRLSLARFRSRGETFQINFGGGRGTVSRFGDGN